MRAFAASLRPLRLPEAPDAFPGRASRGRAAFRRGGLVAVGARLATLLLAGCGGGEPETAPEVVDALHRVAFFSGGEGAGGDGAPPTESIGRAFVLDRFEVTKEEYGAFVAETGYRGAGAAFLADWVGSAPPPGREDHPVVMVSLEDAEAFARWRGMRVPTPFELERARRGRAGHRYPWGQRWDAGRANTLELGLFDTTRVGTFESGRSPEFCYDLVGNVWEWTSDPEGRLAGGSMWERMDHESPPFEMRIDPGVRWSTLGFRCAADAAPWLERTLVAAPAGLAGDAPLLLRIARRWGRDAAPALRELARRPGVPAVLVERMADAAESTEPGR